MSRAYYYQNIRQFLADEESFVIGELVKKHQFAVDEQQRNAWVEQIRLLKAWLKDVAGYVIFEYSAYLMLRRVMEIKYTVRPELVEG